MLRTRFLASDPLLCSRRAAERLAAKIPVSLNGSPRNGKPAQLDAGRRADGGAEGLRRGFTGGEGPVRGRGPRTGGEGPVRGGAALPGALPGGRAAGRALPGGRAAGRMAAEPAQLREGRGALAH